mmetsp:Transcript_2362/g.6701  ORF Transcript_2362/g.6701 Transcript_2362/m.6701 type:complete len:212 (+) Transcript_2362:1733-2368(+)
MRDRLVPSRFLPGSCCAAQRAEAIHSAIKRVLHSKLLLTDAAKYLVRREFVHMVRKEEQQIKEAVRNAFVSREGYPAYIVKLQPSISNHAYELLMAQYKESCKYSLEEMEMSPEVQAMDTEQQISHREFIVRRNAQDLKARSTKWTNDDKICSDLGLLCEMTADEGRRATLRTSTFGDPPAIAHVCHRHAQPALPAHAGYLSASVLGCAPW